MAGGISAGNTRRMIQITEQESKQPICPHCEEKIKEIHVRRVEAFLGVRYLYFCSHCRKVLGLSHRKGFWMG